MKELTKRRVEEFLSQYGEDELIALLISSMSQKTSNHLTIICDDTMHQIPEALIEGEKFVFSRGNFDTSNSETIEEYLSERLLDLRNKLNEREWGKIILIFSGHAILSATIKLFIYRITHKETEDIIYFGSSGYKRVNINMRVIGSQQA